MINPAPYLRQTIYALLNNAVTYDGDVVPVYEGEGNSHAPMQILISTYSDADQSNKTTFGANVSQVIEVQGEQMKITRKGVDIIGEQVMQLIHSQPSDDNLSGGGFSVCVVGRPSINYLPDVSGSGAKIVRLILRFQLLIQNN
jgi:hypothetical protein